MALDLVSVQAKVEHSADHFDALDDKIQSWTNGGFDYIVYEKNAQFTEHRLIYRCKKEPDVVGWSLMFADCIHNLRTALDHLVYAVAIHESGKTPPPNWNGLAFPIKSKPEAFSNFRKDRLNHLSSDVLAAIETMQPYNRKHPTFLPLLTLLRQFDDADKHRLLQLTVTQAVEWEFYDIKGLSAESGRLGFIPHDVGSLKDNTEVATLITDGPAPNLDFDKFGLKVGIVVEHEAGPSGTTHTFVHDMEQLLALEVATAIDRVVAAVK